MSTLSHQLSFMSRHKLAQVLDQDNIRGCDWRALVEQMGFTYEMILFLRDKKSPTMSLLEEWEMKEGSSATIDLLIQMVEQIENVPAIQVLKIVKDKMTVCHRSTNSSPSPVVHLSDHSCSTTSHSLNGDQTEKSPFMKDIDPINRSMDCPPAYNQIEDVSRNEEVKKFNQKFQDMALNNTTSVNEVDDRRQSYPDDDISKGQSLSDMDRSLLEGTEFDIFLSFASADSSFADEMRLRLEERANISCYIPSEGLMPGQAFQDEIADKIKRGCRKTIVIMSPSYTDSPWCTYEARLAHHKSPDPRRHVLIPVMYSKCKVPDFISYLYYLDYPRYKDDPIRCERYFWERLYKAIQLPQT